MAAENTDIKTYLTAADASAGWASSSTTANSLGRFLSTTEIVSGSLHNLFDVVTGAENAANDVEYRCFAIANQHATDDWTDVEVWIDSQVTGGASIAIGIDPAGPAPRDQGTAQGAVIANESIAPSGVTFSQPSSGSKLAVGDIAALECVLIWVRRTCADTEAVSNDGATIAFTGVST